MEIVLLLKARLTELLLYI